jgi:hypothetical protein
MARRSLRITLIVGSVILLIALGWIAFEIWFGLTKAR